MPHLRQTTGLLLALAAIGVSLGLVAPTRSADVAQPTRVLRHLVMYQFKKDLSAAQLQEVIDTFSALPKQIDTIIGFERGTTVSQEGKSAGLTHAFQVTFRDAEGLKKYLAHPAHQRYVEIAGPRREKVIVFDYWTEQ